MQSAPRTANQMRRRSAMSQKEVSVNLGGIFAPLLGVLFIGLKLTGYINWPWLWVLSPIWIPAAIVFGFLGLFGIICGILKLAKK
jgi:hypothetical protein